MKTTGIDNLQKIYFLLNIAYQDELNKAHQALKNTKYYDGFTDENKKYLKVEKP